ncbi:Receptor-type tyrosine-protein phosphatase F [Madurella mycetomatis]|uniref:Receptor-type tyrosine-protein phosphatase F n=1 Tax=Madurella mycetomatis TaxID=100816 RepID=A0A175VQH5_9PEZI|nr:Receptor-type tyrosine-protein phosphatase F [Madurella mycetomatis]
MALSMDPQHVDGGVTKVMVVGDSISQGREGDRTWRYRIWEWLRQQGILVSFVGPYKGTIPPDDPEPPQPPPLASEPSRRSPPPQTDGGYAADVAPEFLENSDHFSASGRSAHQARWLIGEQVAAYKPDICLVQLGFNDLGWRVTGPKDTLGSIKHLIDEARSVKPDLKFAVANVPHRTDLPGRSDLPVNTDIYNALLARSIPHWSLPGSPIALVRLCENYSCGGTTSEAAYDGLHPNALGEYQLTQAFSRALVSSSYLGRTELVIPEQIPPRPIATPANLVAAQVPNGVVVTWDPIYGAYGYDVRARLAGSTDWNFRYYVTSNRYDTRYCVTGQEWEYRVRACAGDGIQSRWSGVVSAVARPETAPGPRSIATHATPTGFSIAWEPPTRGFTEDIDRYGVVVLDRDAPGSFPCVEGVRGQCAELKGLMPGHRYNVAVETWTSVGGGLPAGARSVMVGRGTPSAPPWVCAVVVNDTTAELRWAGDPDAAGYRVWIRNLCAVGCDGLEHEARQLCDVSPDPEAADPKLRKCLLSSLLPSVRDFQFAVSAYNGNNDSDLSEWVVAPFLEHEAPSVEEWDTIHITLGYT